MNEQDALIGGVKGAVSGIRSALAAGKELEALGSDIRELGMADLRARQAYRRKQRRVKADTTIFSAVEEWRVLYENRKVIDQLKADVIKAHGRSAWDEIERIKTRILKDNQDDTDEWGRDLTKMRHLKWWCFWAAAFVTYLLHLGGFI